MFKVNDPRILDRRRFSSKKITIEKIVRLSFRRTVKEYVTHCSLAGVRKFCDPNIGCLQRFFWLAIFITAVLTVIYFLLYIWSGALNSPLIVTRDSWSYQISNVDFPAIAICAVNRISKAALIKYTKDKYPVIARRNESFEDVLAVTRQWGRLLDFSYDESLVKNRIYQALVKMYREDTSRIIDTMRSLAPACEDILMKCSWLGHVVDCKNIFRTRRTSLGHCCTFNYIINFDSNGRPEKSPVEVKRQTVPGYFNGLSVILDPMIDDYSYPLIPMLGFDVIVYSPNHYPDIRAGRMMIRKVVPNKTVFIEVRTTKQIATKEVRKYSPSTRRCLFHDDLEKKYRDMYSYSACILTCRIETIESLCKCIPYSAMNDKNMKSNVCSLENLRCLNKYKEKLYYIFPTDTDDYVGLEIEFQESIYCIECLPDCEATQYYTKAFETYLSTPGYPEKDFQLNFTKGINLTDKSVLHVYHPLADAGLERLDIVNYWYEILSNIGGFAGLVMGFSIASIFEIVYYIFIRFYHILFLSYRRYYRKN